jgi:hypothetical protein
MTESKIEVAVDWTYIRKDNFFCDRCKEFENVKYPISSKEMKDFNLKHSSCLPQLEFEFKFAETKKAVSCETA